MTSSGPALSVVIPTRDTRELTLACLASLHRPEPPHPGLEVIVVDDASEDDTAAAVERLWPDVHLLRHDESVGFSGAVNAGLTRTTAPLILLLNSDTEVESGALRVLLKAFGTVPELGVLGVTLVYPDGSQQWSHGSLPTPLWAFAVASGLGPQLARLRSRFEGSQSPSPASASSGSGWQPTGWVTGAALAVRRRVIDEIGGFDEDFAFYAQDLDLCQRAADAGWCVGWAPEAVILHHHGATIEQGRRGPVIARQQPRLLWTDLVRWARKQGGERAAARLFRALAWGGRLRLLAQSLSGPLLLLMGRASRGRLRAERSATRDALTALSLQNLASRPRSGRLP